MKTTNLLIQILSSISVKHTEDFTIQYYESHPNKYNLLGISQILDAYKVENIGVNIPRTIEAISKLECPFLAYVSNYFVIVTSITDKKVSYIFNDNDISIPIENFLKIWSGDALLFIKSDDSIEPEYTKHLKETALKKILLYLEILSVACLCGVPFYQNWSDYTYDTILHLLINVIGIALCIPLLRVQINKYDKFTQKACSLLSKKSKCNTVTNSPASSFFGISLSSIGMAYFIVNFLFLLLCPRVISTLSLLNSLILPFTIWSIWYQIKRVKELCSLCISVQFIIWTIFILDVINCNFQELNVWNFISICCIYFIGVLSVHTYSQYNIMKKEAIQYNYQIHALKSNFSVFNSLLQEQPKYPISTNLGLLAGNTTSSNIITIISNPHCDPCSKLHSTIKDLLKNNGNYKIQFILTSFNKELEGSCHLWIAMHQTNSPEAFIEFMDDWYSNGRYNYQEYYRQYATLMNNQQVYEKYNQQKEWLVKTSITNTPTILFNGYTLPEQYELKDLIDLDI
ncbi:vitamin K epoxide reductase family protein [Phocaeicola barnesiae]|uniref:vitamin K epoxide reductase family protein n=1 Tax=Phocaeicola barnesiae TaxID=376804 RepID=UPI0024310CC9|nr:vitamin K epoxide reductase family protein [Phocaeicola barnesiae]